MPVDAFCCPAVTLLYLWPIHLPHLWMTSSLPLVGSSILPFPSSLSTDDLSPTEEMETISRELLPPHLLPNGICIHILTFLPVVQKTCLCSNPSILTPQLTVRFSPLLSAQGHCSDSPAFSPASISPSSK